MLKLLTEEERDKVSKEYVVRRTIVVTFSLSTILVIGIIGLMPSYILTNIRYREAFELAKTVDNSDTPNEDANLKGWLGEINGRLAIISPKLDSDRPSDFIKKVLTQKIKGISITDFSWTKNADKIDLVVGGVASDRQTLVMFRDGLGSSQYFSGVTLPISDLAKDKEISFKIKFSLL